MPGLAVECERTRTGAAGFTELALDFHRRADAIGEAAADEDVAGVLAATASTLSACTACHAAYRQEVVDARTWQERTGRVHGPM